MRVLSLVKRNISSGLDYISYKIAKFKIRYDNKRDFSRVIIVSATKGNGIARGAEMQYDLFQKLGIDSELLYATESLKNPFFKINHQAGSVYIFHCAGPHTPFLINSVMPHASRAYRVAYWAWELPDPPAEWTPYINLVDEIWTPSDFSRKSLQKIATCRVEAVHHHIVEEVRKNKKTQGRFNVLVMADSRSSFSRKNPLYAIKAFKKAFSADSHARMIVKISGKQKDIDKFLNTEANVSKYPNITVLRKHLNETELRELYEGTDVLISTHRAEGFGLPLLEAMARGIPVVATGWSGNIDFMDESNSIMLPFEVIPVNDPNGVYHGSVWAEPSIDAASEALKKLYEDHRFYEVISERAFLSVKARKPKLSTLC